MLQANHQYHWPCKEVEKLKKHESYQHNKKFYLAKREEILKQQKDYRSKNPEKVKASRSKYYEANRERILEQKKRYNAKRKEEKINKNQQFFLCLRRPIVNLIEHLP